MTRGHLNLHPTSTTLTDVTRSVEEMERELKSHGSAAEVREVLGLDEVRFQLLEASSLLSILPEQDRVNHLRRFLWKEAHGLLAAWKGDAQELPAGEELISLLDETAVAPRRFIDALTAARDGSLRAAAVVPGEAGLRGIRFRREDVDQVLWPDVAWMGSGQVAQRLGVQAGTVGVWIRRGFLCPTVRDGDTANFDTAAIRAFQAEFLVGGTDPRDPTARRNRYLTRHIKAVGVAPASGRGVDGLGVALFRRADFTPDVLRRLTARVEAHGRMKPYSSVGMDQARARIARLVAKLWGTTLVASWNATHRFANGRLLLVVPGRQLSVSSNYRFRAARSGLEAAEGAADGWLALLSPMRAEFILVRCGDVRFGPAGPGNPNRLLSLPRRENLPEELRSSLIALVKPA